MLTFEGICYSLYDYPDMLEDIVETCYWLVEHSLNHFLPTLSFDYAGGWEDMCLNHGPILPTWFFRDVVAPRYKRISKKLRKHEIDIWYTDCDGDVRELILIFLDSGINCLYPLEAKGSGHLGVLLDRNGKDLLIMGGLDKLELAKGENTIDRYLDSIAPYVERGGYIPFCDHHCPLNVKEEYYLYYLDWKEKLIGMS